MSAEELLYPPARSKRDTLPVDAVRAFVFLSGVKWMEQRGVLERFRELLTQEQRDSVHTMVATDWIPLDEALSVYAACDALGLSEQDQIDLGRAVSAANNGVFVRTIANLIGRLGATPWLAMKHAERTWHRSNRGGAIAVYKVGEKTARIEFWQVPLARSPFFVTSMRGAIAIGIEPFCERAVVTELREHTTRDGFALRVAW